MEKGNLQHKQGFTIIEVLLVLAIAGLIFLMIFIALPGLQRAQRDSKRRDDISILLKKVKDFQTNNRGALPTKPAAGPSVDATYSSTTTGITWSGFYHDYLGEGFEDPSGGNYMLHVSNCKTTGGRVNDTCDDIVLSTDAFSEERKIKISIGATCNGDQAVVSSNPRKIAVQYKLEGGGVYCANT